MLKKVAKPVEAEVDDGLSNVTLLNREALIDEVLFVGSLDRCNVTGENGRYRYDVGFDGGGSVLMFTLNEQIISLMGVGMSIEYRGGRLVLGPPGRSVVPEYQSEHRSSPTQS